MTNALPQAFKKSRLEKAIIRCIAKETEKRAKQRAKSPPREPIRSPSYDQLQLCCECSVGYNDTGFHRSVIIADRQYVVTAICYGNNYTEFYMHELLPAWTTDPKLLEGGSRATIVNREGTSERYALGRTVYYRNRKFHRKPLEW